MMLPLVSDENVNNILLRRLLRQYPDLDLVRVQDVGLLHADDVTVLAWAASEGRILLTHDTRTIPGFVYDRFSNDLSIPGVILIPEKMALSNEVYESLRICLECSDSKYWENRLERLPF